MARHKKSGVRYVLLNVDFFNDVKVACLRNCFGCNAATVYLDLLCRINRSDGYYIPWSEELANIVANELGLTPDYVYSAVNGCINVGLFDGYLFNRFFILTSKSIQQHYYRMRMISRSIYSGFYQKEYLLIDVDESQCFRIAGNGHVFDIYLDAIWRKKDWLQYQSAFRGVCFDVICKEFENYRNYCTGINRTHYGILDARRGFVGWLKSHNYESRTDKISRRIAEITEGNTGSLPVKSLSR